MIAHVASFLELEVCFGKLRLRFLQIKGETLRLICTTSLRHISAPFENSVESKSELAVSKRYLCSRSNVRQITEEE